jgi:hypothetical protein
MIPDESNARNPEGNVRTLGILWVLYGVIRLIAAAWLVFFSTTATLMFGALLSRVPDPFALMDIFHILYGVVVAVSAVCGILGVLAGMVLLARSPSGRTLTVVVAIFSLSSIPLGTTLGIYSLIVLLPGIPRRTVAAAPRMPIPDLKRQPTTM